MARCLDGGDEVEVDHLLQMFDSSNNNFDDKEVAKLREIAGGDKHISKFDLFNFFHPYNSINFLRAEFIEFCKTSHTIKNLIELESKGPRSRSGSTQAKSKVLGNNI